MANLFGDDMVLEYHLHILAKHMSIPTQVYTDRAYFHLNQITYVIDFSQSGVFITGWLAIKLDWLERRISEIGIDYH